MGKGSLLSTQQLCVQYKVNNYKLNALKGINLTLPENGNLGIIGESGSGKTTLALALMGLI
ncbi:MAG TPA: ATP-binding cassette domain-containing protein, partial [Clostridia bacterium]|nr:ATP-binding cassette domain-containing protein [Clostridia bacterium]